jgi:hypothetical protein
MTIVLYIIGGIGLLLALDGLVARTKIQHKIDDARRQRPVDEGTGLLNQRAYLHRITGELKRAQRSHSNVWLGVWTVVDGDPDRFGRVAADGLRFPEVGFRLAERVFCFVRPGITEDQRADLLLRLRSGAPREKAASGEVTWTGGQTDAMRLLHIAIEGMS